METKKINIKDSIGLQIDNLVYNHHGELHQIGANDFQKFRYPDMGHDYGLYAIELTEEWLIKLGFVKITGLHLCKGFQIKNGEWLVYISERGTYFKLSKHIFIKYVHQLQNLYFALTGEELTIK